MLVRPSSRSSFGTCRRTGDLYHRLLGERYGCNSAHPNVHAEWLNYRNTKSRIDQRVCVNLRPKIHLPRNKHTENYCQSINLFSHILPASLQYHHHPRIINNSLVWVMNQKLQLSRVFQTELLSHPNHAILIGSVGGGFCVTLGIRTVHWSVLRSSDYFRRIQRTLCCNDGS